MILRPLAGDRERERDLEGDLVDERLRLTGLADLRSRPRDPAELLRLLLRTAGERERDRLLEARFLLLARFLPDDRDEPESEDPDEEDEEESEESESESESESEESESELDELSLPLLLPL